MSAHGRQTLVRDLYYPVGGDAEFDGDVREDSR